MARAVSPVNRGAQAGAALPGRDPSHCLVVFIPPAAPGPDLPAFFVDLQGLSWGREVPVANRKPAGNWNAFCSPAANLCRRRRPSRLGCSAGNRRGGWKGVCKALRAARPG